MANFLITSAYRVFDLKKTLLGLVMESAPTVTRGHNMSQSDIGYKP